MPCHGSFARPRAARRSHRGESYRPDVSPAHNKSESVNDALDALDRGAEPERPVLRDAVRLVAGGLVVGIPAALIIGRIAADRLSGVIYGVGATDPLTLGAVVLTLLAVAATAACIPAARAGRIDPIRVLRH